MTMSADTIARLLRVQAEISRDQAAQLEELAAILLHPDCYPPPTEEHDAPKPH